MAYILKNKQLGEVSKFQLINAYSELRSMYFRRRKLEQHMDVLFQVAQLALLCAINFKL